MVAAGQMVGSGWFYGILDMQIAAVLCPKE